MSSRRSEATAYWVDANVLLRFLTGEPPELADRAQRFFESAERREISVLVHQIAVAETVWVLESFYDCSKQQIAEALLPLLEGRALSVEDKRITLASLETMVAENVDFADALIACTAHARGEVVASFDRDFGKLARALDLEWQEP